MKTTKFKPSEVGPIPVEWEVRKLGELLDFKNGYNADAKNYGRGTPVASVLDALAERPLKASSIRARVSAPPRDRESFSLKRGDLIFTRSSETLEDVGRSNVYDDEAVAMFGGFVIRGRPKTDNNSTFINLLLKTRGHRDRVMSQGAGAQHYNIGQSGLERVLVSLPPLPEQKAIAEALSDVDALLAAMTTLIEKKRAIKQGAMQQLLTGKKRLAGFAGKWVEKRLGEIADFVTATTPTATIDLKWYIGTENMLAEKVGVIQNDAEVPYKAVREYLKGDVLVSNIRPYLKKIWLADCDGGCSTDVLVIRTHDRSICIPEFLVMLISDDAFFDFAMSNAVGTKMPRGDKKVLVNFGVKLPSLAEQKAIAAVLSDMDAEIAALEAKRAKYERIKQGMMQELLTGKTRLLPPACTRADAGRCGPTRGTCGG